MYDVTKIQDQITPEGVRVIFANTCREVCSQQLGVAVKNGIILEAGFVGGCSGNAQGVCRLIAGMKAEDAISRLEGIRCGAKPTSCPDQLAKGLKQYLKMLEDGTLQKIN